MSTATEALRGPRAWSLPLVRLVAIGVLAAAAAIVAWSALPMVWGWRPTVIVSGSMSPSVHRGDIVVSSPPTADWQPAVGQVVTVPYPGHAGQTLTHRIAGFDERGLLITRGDANGSDDSFRTPPAQVRGVGRLLVPRIGLATLKLREGHPWLFIAQSVAVLAAVGLASRLPAAPVETPAPAAAPVPASGPKESAPEPAPESVSAAKESAPEPAPESVPAAKESAPELVPAAKVSAPVETPKPTVPAKGGADQPAASLRREPSRQSTPRRRQKTRGRAASRPRATGPRSR
ncbi:S26 family signal peptidase [Actinoplanes sp. NPDC049548]|uniref:S26 family signal peptidase n=1 Tax=Actinoplanes sp. NPDC049548 TaxID=3155152 RepID=UPI0034373EFE